MLIIKVEKTVVRGFLRKMCVQPDVLNLIMISLIINLDIVEFTSIACVDKLAARNNGGSSTVMKLRV